MTASLVELRRRLTWLWRLSCSAPLCEATAGGGALLWVFDTRTAPDGYTLRPHAIQIAQAHGLALWSWGPRAPSAMSALRFIRMMPTAFSKRFSKRFHLSVGEAFQTVGTEVRPIALMSGSFKGEFASLLRDQWDRAQLWEIQHGFLDESYFPLHAGAFFARSRLSAQIVRGEDSEVRIEMIDDDLEPPTGLHESMDFQGTVGVKLFSKNPGGGCTTQEVRELEDVSADLAKRLNLPFTLHLHPRDNLAKLIWRHRGPRLLGAALRGTRPAKTGPSLIISSFSTALATRSQPADRLLNLELSPTPRIRAAQYGWLATTTRRTVEANAPFSVFRRTV